MPFNIELLERASKEMKVKSVETDFAIAKGLLQQAVEICA